MSDEPDAKAASAMACEVLADVAQITRFPTGLRHFVFEATSSLGRPVVVRASRREDVGIVENSLYWSAQLRPRGVPLPEVLHADTAMARHAFPFVILERLSGRDLHLVLEELAGNDRRHLVDRLCEVQSIVTGLPLGQGYGFTPRLEGPFPDATWADSVSRSLARSRQRICDAKIVSEEHADRVEAAAEGFAAYFATVQPVPFLHDITTKNVIIQDARLSGIVDVDDLCFGDPLFLVGLIRVALLAHGRSPAYADAWLDVLRPDKDQREALDFYVALFCLNFMSELGQRFNRARPAPVEQAYLDRLSDPLDEHLS